MRMVSFITETLVFLIISMTLQEGCGLPVAEQPVQTSHPHHIRTKRCSCNNWEDKECIYFCHLDIIWINTPSKVLPYGLGSLLSRRRRRSASRCECLNAADKTCHGFCHQRSDDGRNESTSTSSSKLLGFFRNVVKANVAIVKSRSPSRVKKLKNGTRR